MLNNLRFWFIPAWCGDYRLVRDGDDACVLTVVDPTDADRSRLGPFLDALRTRGFIDATVGLASKGETVIRIPAPMGEMGPLLSGLTSEASKAWTAVRVAGGAITVEDGTAISPAAAPEAEAAVTVRPPVRGCPAPTPAERRASEVLRVFSTVRQARQYAGEGRMRVIGNATGRAYHLYHRDEAAARGLARNLVEAATGNPICVYDPTIPPEEETLAIKLAVEHREAWLLHRAVGAGEGRLGVL